MQQSGTSGQKVVVNGTTDEVGKALAVQMVADLKAIGYKASAQLLAGSIQYPYVQNSDNHKCRSPGRPGTRTTRRRRTS